MYRIISSGELKTKHELRKLNPNVSLPKVWTENTMLALGVEPVEPTPEPEVGPLKMAVPNGAEKNADGKWIQSWSIVDKYQDELDESGSIVRTKTEIEAKALAESINLECQRRIYAVASDNAQKNLAANSAAGELTAEQQATFREGVRWITSCQDAARMLFVNREQNFTDDGHWPPPTQDMIDLADQF